MLTNYSRLLFAAAFIAVLTFSTSCLRERKYVPVSKQSLKGSGKLYFVPLGDFPAGNVEDLVSYYRDKYGLTIETLPSVPLPPAATNPEREQLIAEVAVENMRQANPKLSNDPQAILIGLTTQDMYISQYDWRFSFSWREQQKFAVVSAGRMNLPLSRRPVSEDQIQMRLRKMVTKNIGVLYYRLPQSDNPKSVLYRNVGGIQELDYMGEEF
jgi:predicted Zn-dependent protease